MLFFILLLPYLFASNNGAVVSQTSDRFNFEKLNLPTTSVGPESITFDSQGGGPYTGISDGRILRYNNRTSTFHDFAFTVPNRSKEICDGSNSPDLRVSCGRPLGIDFRHAKQELFIADAARGLFVVGPAGGLATRLAAEADGRPFKFLNGLAVDQETGDVYFTEFSTEFSISEVERSFPSNDSSGRLLKYESESGGVSVLKSGLRGANGVALSADRSYLLFAEFTGLRIQRFWLSGPRALSSEIVAELEGPPDNIKRNSKGHFWVAFNVHTPKLAIVPTAVEFNGSGHILTTLPLAPYLSGVSEFIEHGLHYYAGSIAANFVGVLNYNHLH